MQWSFFCTDNESCIFRAKYLVKDPVHKSEPIDEEFWFQDAQEKLKRDRNMRPVNKKARNVIFFLSDGMGISTQTAARYSN